MFWQLDVNITRLQGVTVQLFNGTSFFFVGQGKEIGAIEFRNGDRNFTYNVTFNVTEAEYDDFGITDSVRDSKPSTMKGTDYVTALNQLFVTFTAIEGFKNPSFLANIGLRYYNKTWEDLSFELGDDDEDTEYVVNSLDLKELEVDIEVYKILNVDSVEV